jgi:hypothetical protein
MKNDRKRERESLIKNDSKRERARLRLSLSQFDQM